MPGQGQQPQIPSTVTLTRTDKVIVCAIDLVWKEEFQAKIRPSLNDYFDGIAGQAMLLASTQPWQKLSDAVKQFHARGKFPRGALARPSLAARMGLPFAPEQRCSWMVELLPALGYKELYAQIDKSLGWNSPQNLRVARAWIPELLDPGANDPDTWRANLTSVVGRDLGATHFVGLSGIGVDAAELADTPENAKRLGIFGYERETAVNAVTDGLDKTIFMIQVDSNIARPWIRGGGATVMGVTPTESVKPFRVMQANRDYGAYAIMCDGSIRFVKPDCPDALFQAMVTYKAGDSTDGIDTFAPKVEAQTNRLRLGGPKGGTGPDVAPQYMPKDWQPISLRVMKAAFGVAMPPGKIDATVDQSADKAFSGSWPGKNLTLAAHATYRPGQPTADPTGAAAEAEVAHYLDVVGLERDGSVTDAPNLGPSKGKQFRARPKNTPDAKATTLYRLWVVHEARLVLSVTGPAGVNEKDAEEFFKSATAAPIRQTEDAARFGPKDWIYWYSPRYRFAIKFPGVPTSLGNEELNLYLMFPKFIEGGSLFTLALKSVELDPTIDADKAYKAMEKAAKEGKFGDNAKNLRRKFLGDRAGIMYEEMRGDIPYTVWAVYNNEESAVVVSVRKNAGLSATDEKTFFDSLQVGMLRPPPELEKKQNGPGTPGVPGVPGAPPLPGGGPGTPPGIPPPPPGKPGGR